MKTIKFLRTTHVDGEPKPDLPGYVKVYGLGVHALSPDTPMSFAEILEAHLDYADEYDDFKMPDIMDLWDDLGVLYKQGMIDMIVENNGGNLRAFLEGLEVQNIEQLINEGTPDRFRSLGKLMKERIVKLSISPEMELGQLLMNNIIGDVKTEN